MRKLPAVVQFVQKINSYICLTNLFVARYYNSSFPQKLLPQGPLLHFIPPFSAAKEEEKTAWQKMREGINTAWSAFRQDDALLEQGPAAQRLYGGRMNDARRQEASMVTREAMSKLHKALESMPAETDEEQDPIGLKSKYKLFPHQKQGLAWLIWRETHNPAG